ncbi:hypothetical protein GGI25_005234 [Coemansia spiralis]|uniref:RNA helicase n=2 Tax=Coemansia TaxID=4863 RepID=A0A9W8KWB3_9FUNG|nr:hypothetical protein GGI25_005234 [Coemansia spiralis]
MGQVDEGSFIRSYYADGFTAGDTASKMFLHEQRRRLPAFKHRMELLYAVEKYLAVVVVGEPGSGKSTQVPQFLYEAGWAAGGKVIVCTQPRRVAAAMLAHRVAEEMDVALGTTVGYSVRFSDVSSAENTRIKYMTDGTLMHECLADPMLSKYSVVVVDEAQDRSLDTDTLLALLKKIMKKRKGDFRVIISSASLDAERFRGYFETNDNTLAQPEHNTATILSISGRIFPVDIHYLTASCENYLVAATETATKIHISEGPGDILIFLPGKNEIEQAISTLNDQIDSSNNLDSLLPLAMYAGISAEKQKLVFDPPERGIRKAIFSTNVAETAVTIDGVVYVVDSGLVKRRIFDTDTNIDRLATLTISKSSAKQRAGRSGRTRPGKTYRLYTREAYLSSLFPEHEIPEICRVSLVPMVLMLKALGVSNLVRFDYLQPPPPELLSQALELLAELGAIDSGTGELTPKLGLHLAELPLSPELGVCLLNSVRTFDCAKEAISAVSMLAAGGDPFFVPGGQRSEALEDKRDFMVQEGDVLTFVNTHLAYLETPARMRVKWCNAHFLSHRMLDQSARIHRQLEAMLARMGYHNRIRSSCGRDYKSLQKCIASGLFANAARLDPSDGRRYRLIKNGLVVDIHPSSIFFAADCKPNYVVFAQVMETTKVYIRGISAVDPAWLSEIAPHYYSAKQSNT